MNPILCTNYSTVHCTISHAARLNTIEQSTANTKRCVGNSQISPTAAAQGGPQVKARECHSESPSPSARSVGRASYCLAVTPGSMEAAEAVGVAAVEQPQLYWVTEPAAPAHLFLGAAQRLGDHLRRRRHHHHRRHRRHHL